MGLVAELCNVGTLFAFIVATSGLLVLRKRKPNIERPFICPAPWILVPVAVICCLFIMFSLPSLTLYLFFTWAGIGLIVYFVYGRSHSTLGLAAEGIESVSDNL